MARAAVSSLSRLLRSVEERWGNLEALVEPTPRWIARVGAGVGAEAAGVRQEELEALFQHEVCYVHVRGYLSPAAAQQCANVLLEEERAGKATNWMVSTARGLEETDVYTIGMPHNVFLAMEHEGRDGDGGGAGYTREEYAQRATEVNRLFRDRQYRRKITHKRKRQGQYRQSNSKGEELVLAATQQVARAAKRAPESRAEEEDGDDGLPEIMSPVDRLRLDLDEAWPQGAMVGKARDGSSLLAGLARITRGPTADARGSIHVDELAPLSPAFGQFSANVYLQLPPAGGKLCIWPMGFRSRWEFYRNATTLSLLASADAKAQDVLWNALPPPLVVDIAAGDLVLLCAQRPHAAQGFNLGTRVSMQTFISHSAGQALQLDC